MKVNSNVSTATSHPTLKMHTWFLSTSLLLNLAFPSKKNEKSISEKMNSERECSVIWCFNQEKIFQRKQMSQDRNIYISIIFTLEFLFWLCRTSIIFQMHVGLQNSRAPRNTCLYKVKKKKPYSALKQDTRKQNKYYRQTNLSEKSLK